MSMIFRYVVRSRPAGYTVEVKDANGVYFGGVIAGPFEYRSLAVATRKKLTDYANQERNN